MFTIEYLKIYNHKHRYKDLFFALSHGVNFGGLRNNANDEREVFLKNLLFSVILFSIKVSSEF